MNTRPATLHTLRCGRLQADITNVGARIVRYAIDGIDVVQGFDSPADYLPSAHRSDFGALVGRYANRIAGGRVEIGGQVVSLPQNDGPNCLHGGPMGWQYSIFEILSASDHCLELALISPDGDNGFPGTIALRVRYTLDALGLRADYRAETDRPTVINITNHSYFNLSGDPSSSVLDHCLMIDADFFTPVDPMMIPLGNHLAVDGTPMDFRQAKPLGRDIEADFEQLRLGRGYDHNFVLRRPGLDRVSASLTSPRSGIALQILTTAPGLQLYTGNFLDGVRGKQGIAYGRQSAVCLETQFYPDSPNHKWAESSGRLEPGSPFCSSTIYRLSR